MTEVGSTQDERERAIEQGAKLLARECHRLNVTPADRNMAEVLYDVAGWRPPPSGDVIEAAFHVGWKALERQPVAANETWAIPARAVVQALAAKGYLRTPGEQDDDSMATEILRLHERLRTPGESVSIPTEFVIENGHLLGKVDACTGDCGGPGPDFVHHPHCGWEPVVDLATVPGWESAPIPVPPPDEVLERTDAERRVRDRIIDKGWGSCTVSASDIKDVLNLLDQARTALRAAGETS